MTSAVLDLGPTPNLLFLANDAARVRGQLAGAQLTRAQAGALRDDVSTDEITPVRILSYYDERLARFPYTGFQVGGETPVAPGAVQAGGFQVVVAGRRYGKGSSREHSPAAEKLAGVRLVIAESFERIYRQNADNIGLFTSTDFGLIGRLQRGEAIPLDELVAGRDALAAAILRSGGLLAFGQAHLGGGAPPAPPPSADVPRTLFEKIVLRHMLATPVTSATPPPGEGCFVRADWRFIHEYYTGMAAHMLHAALGRPLALHDPDSIVVFEDHTSYVEESPAHVTGGLVPNMQAMMRAQRDFAAAYGLRSHRTLTDAEAATDDGSNVAGISHAMMAEHYALPGQVVVGTDSHTPHSGALGCVAFGVGTTDMANAFVTGAVRLTMPQVLRVELAGLLPEGVAAKDVVLHLLQLPALRAGGGVGKVFEFTGSAVRALSTDERATLTNMTAELGGLTGIVAPDAETVRFLKERRGADFALEGWMASDAGASYCETIHVDCAGLVPMVAAPGDPGNAIPITDLAASVKVDIAYGGSCTAGKREDFDHYHAVLAWGLKQGLRVPPSVRLYLQYGTTAVRDYCVARGYDRTFAAVGARILQPSCGACANCGPGASSDAGQVTVSAINRNFPGRSGPGQVWLASPATVMASALAGELLSFAQLRARTAESARTPLAIAEERLKLALAASQLALWDLDMVRGRVFLTEGWSLLLGGPPVPTETTPGALLAMVPDEDRAAIEAGLRSVLRVPAGGAGGLGGRYSVEHRLRRPDGSVLWLRSQGEVAERDAAGRALRMIGTNRDVTRERRAAEELRETRDAADAASRAKSEFLATISHEIRTPLNGIVGLARLLLDEPLQARGRQQAELIDSSAQTLLALVNDVLDFSKIEAGQLAIEQITFNLHDLVEEVATLYKLRASEKSLLFRLHLDPAVPRHVRGDPGRIRQILGNLLGNSLKFTRRGWVGLHVGVVASAPEPTLEFVVSDTGAGIPQEMQPRLFTPFVQGATTTARNYGGTGLGLSIVKQLCELMGGGVRLRSREGKGTKFTVTLPYGAPAEDHVSTWQELLPAALPARILVAEDNTTNQVVVMGMLDKLGYADVALAQDGRQAFEMARGNAYDIILMDCNMPEMDGYEATRLLRDAGCKSAIVAMTANAIKGDRERCLAAGMDDYLTKPIGLREFGETVAAWAARGRTAWSTLTPAGDLAPSTMASSLPAATAEPPVFDAAGVLARYGNDEQLLAMSVHTFLQVTPGLLDQLAQAAHAGDAEAARRHAHTVKGSAAMVGAERLSFHAAQLEMESATLPAGELSRRAAGLRARFEEYRATVRPAA